VGTFARAHQDVIDETQQFSDELQACVQIGSSGDLTGFRTCMQDAYSGVEEDADLAIFVAEDTRDDVAAQCEQALTSYNSSSREYRSVLADVHDVSNRLDFDAFETTFARLTPAASAWGSDGSIVVTQCESK